MRALLTTASALALFAAPAFAQTATHTTPPPGAGTSGATTSGSTASSSTIRPSMGATSGAMTGRTGNAASGGYGTPGAQAAANRSTGSQSASSQSASSQSGNTSSADKTFVKQAAAANIAEVQMGKLAAQKSRNQAVQEFGRWMQTDHTMANALLMQAAQNANVPMPTTPTQADLTKMKALQTMNGMNFNRHYITGQVDAHKMVIQKFQHEARDGSNTQIKGFAKAMIPALQEHLQEAQALQSSLSGSRTATTAAAGSLATGNTGVGAGASGMGATTKR